MESATDRPFRGYRPGTLVRTLAGAALIAATIVGVAASSGNLSTGPRIVDDNQIFSLSRETSAQGFRPTLRDQLVTRARMGRLLPVFLAEKVLKARVYGARVGLWKAHVVGLGILAGTLLYLFLQGARFTYWESLAFALLVVIGPQSVLWVRLIHGEGLGLVLLSLAMLCMVVAIRSDRWRLPLDVAFTGLIVASALCKESFLLVFPAVVAWRLALMWELRGWWPREALARSRWVVASTAGLLVAGLIGCFLLRHRFRRWYVGFDSPEFARIAEASAELTVSTGVVWMVPALAGVLAIVVFRRRRRPEVRRWLVWLGVQTSVALLFVAPQVVLYSRLGFVAPRHPELSVSRYLIPAACGSALLVVALARASREILAAGGRLAPARRLAAVVPAALLVLGVAYQARAAYAVSDWFAATTRRQNDLMDLVRLGTERGDPILVVYDGHHRRVYNRLRIMLKGHAGRPHVLAFPVAGTTPRRQELDRELRDRTLARLRETGRLPGAIVIEEREHVREAFTTQAREWFRPECHRLFEAPRRHALYVPGHCPEAVHGLWRSPAPSDEEP